MRLPGPEAAGAACSSGPLAAQGTRLLLGLLGVVAAARVLGFRGAGGLRGGGSSSIPSARAATGATSDGSLAGTGTAAAPAATAAFVGRGFFLAQHFGARRGSGSDSSGRFASSRRSTVRKSSGTSPASKPRSGAPPVRPVSRNQVVAPRAAERFAQVGRRSRLPRGGAGRGRRASPRCRRRRPGRG